MSADEFKPGQRVEIQDRDRDPSRYAQATVMRAEKRPEFDGIGYLIRPGYVLREDNGNEMWVKAPDVFALSQPDSRIVEKAVAELVTDAWEDAESLSPEDLRQIALTVLRAAQQWQAQQVEAEFSASEASVTTIPDQPLPYAAELEAYERAKRNLANRDESEVHGIARDRQTVAALAQVLGDAVSRAHSA